MSTVLLILVVLLLLGAFPVSRRWGSRGGISVAGLIVVLLILGFLLGWF